MSSSSLFDRLLFVHSDLNLFDLELSCVLDRRILHFVHQYATPLEAILYHHLVLGVIQQQRARLDELTSLESDDAGALKGEFASLTHKALNEEIRSVQTAFTLNPHSSEYISKLNEAESIRQTRLEQCRNSLDKLADPPALDSLYQCIELLDIIPRIQEYSRKVEFTPAESGGKALDLHSFYPQFLQLPWRGQERPALEHYLSFLQLLQQKPTLASIPLQLKTREARWKSSKSTAKPSFTSSHIPSLSLSAVNWPTEFPLSRSESPYSQLLSSLLQYCKGFQRRTSPLMAEQRVDEWILTEWKEKWQRDEEKMKWKPNKIDKEKKDEKEKKEEKEKMEHSSSAASGNNDNAAHSMSQSELECNPLYCRACQKLFAKSTVFQGHLTGKKHLKAVESMAKGENPSSNPAKESEQVKKNYGAQNELQSAEKEVKESKPPKQPVESPVNDAFLAELSCLEHFISHYITDILGSALENAVSDTIRNSSRNVEELEKEKQLEQKRANENGLSGIKKSKFKEKDGKSNDQAAPLYGPRNYPVGWDGRPMPTWLYKLNDLHHVYECEICGNYQYQGKKAFEQHFSEYRHVLALKGLGIQYSKPYFPITKSEEALALAEKLRSDDSKKRFRSEEEEEYEDSEGNVYSKKLYLELQRQGLL